MNVWQTIELIANSGDFRGRMSNGRSNDINAFLKAVSTKGENTSGKDRDLEKSDEENDRFPTTDSLQQHGSQALNISSSYGGSGTKHRKGSSGFNCKLTNAKKMAKRKRKSNKEPKKERKRKYPISYRTRSRGKLYSYGGQNPMDPKDESKGDLPEEYNTVIDCSFDLPKLSARLERLMGSSIVRLTDRKYMKELRKRIQEDYAHTLAKRIEARMLKELERQRNLILEGKTNFVPKELECHPVFVVHNKVSSMAEKRRSMMKTEREKHVEGLYSRAAKFEKEKQMFTEINRKKEEENQARILKEKELENRYFEEDAERGINLLRIHDREYTECELGLKNFLGTERAKMKAHSLKKPHPTTTDPLDIATDLDTSHHIKECDKKMKREIQDQYRPSKIHEYLEKLKAESPTNKQKKKLFELQKKKSRRLLSDRSKKYPPSIDASEEDLQEPITNTRPQKDKLAKVLDALNEQIVKETQEGYLLPGTKGSAATYEDPKVNKLQQTNKIRQLYNLAEDIILGIEEPKIVEPVVVPKRDSEDD